MTIKRARSWHIEAGTLSALAAFAALPAITRATIATSFHGRRFSAHETIIAQKQSDQGVFFVASGAVRVTFFSTRGQEVGFRDLGAGEMFGEIAAIDGQPRSAQVIAKEETFIAWTSPENFRVLLQRHPEISDYVLQHLARLVRLLSERVVEFGTLGVKNRIHAELLRLARAIAGKTNEALLQPSPTHAEIATRVSTHREAVTRELNALARARLIEKSGRSLVIKDIARLEQMVREVSGGVVPK